MTQILIDRIGNVSFLDGIVRVDCMVAKAGGKLEPSGTLLIPGAQAGATLNSLVKSLQELQKQVQSKGPAGTASGTG